jgi:hypothetical protein
LSQLADASALGWVNCRVVVKVNDSNFLEEWAQSDKNISSAVGRIAFDD